MGCTSKCFISTLRQDVTVTSFYFLPKSFATQSRGFNDKRPVYQNVVLHSLPGNLNYIVLFYTL